MIADRLDDRLFILLLLAICNDKVFLLSLYQLNCIDGDMKGLARNIYGVFQNTPQAPQPFNFRRQSRILLLEHLQKLRRIPPLNIRFDFV